ncbi:MAG: DUF362 domain-containing protein [Polyangiaceae bacterium]
MPRRLHALAAIALTACGPRSEPSATSAASSASSPAPVSSPSGSVAPSASAKTDLTTGASVVDRYGDPVVADGKIDGAALRKRNRERLKADTSPVTILEGKSARELGARICEAVVPKRPAATPILLKPNICGIDAVKKPPSPNGDDGVKGRTTDPEFVRGVVRCLKKRGHTKVTIAEGCGLTHGPFEELLEVSGYAAMAREEGVALVGMNDDGTYDVEGEQPGKPFAVTGLDDTLVPTLMLPKVLAEHLDHGLWISIPKLKTHRFSVVSLGIKGMQGVVMTSDRRPAHQQKWRMHKELNEWVREKPAPGEPDDRAAYVADLTAFGKRMAFVLEVAAPDVVLVDGAPATSGDGFQDLRPSKELVAIGGTNTIAVDKVGSMFLGLWNSERLGLGLRGIKSSPLVTIAAQQFGVDLDAVQITGDGAPLLAKPRPVYFKAIAPFGFDVPAPP